ncbi:MAG: carboxypeptidase regulatory-like domain-containing protein, partial [Bacteroidales bacterium]|nr:carboxypeptidase regulatory-like domain-containing protein [Bacteroidales bacterium]
TTMADDKGIFELNVLPGNYNIAVSHQGYDTRILTHVSLKEYLEITSFLLQPTKRKHRTIREPLSIQ